MQKLSARDLDGDQDPDVIVAFSGSGRVAVRLDGPAGFVEGPSPTAQGAGTRSLALEDLDGDGDPDIATVAADTRGGVDIFWNELPRGGALRLEAQALPVNSPFLAAADLDGDGVADLAGVSYFPFSACAAPLSSAWVALNLTAAGGARRLGWTAEQRCPWGPSHAALGDLDGDGRPDLVTRGHPDQLVVFRGTRDITSRDCDSDGVPDECQLDG
ncbi:MAG: VCBS repeat-containing protein, partial [Planctomycetes bacterium]|nr:VCBS repeat-containing protein [Planctomycetota bacterium]